MCNTSKVAEEGKKESEAAMGGLLWKMMGELLQFSREVTGMTKVLDER